MTSIDLLRRLHEHRQWVNRSLMAVASTLTESQLRQQFPIGQGSIWKTLLHLYAAEYIWLEALLGDECPVVPGDLPTKIPGNQESEGAIESLPELDQKWLSLDARWNEHLAKISQDQLDTRVAKRRSLGEGKVFRTKASDILLHVCTHAQYTAAQAVNMMRHVDVDELPDTMLITLARSQAENKPQLLMTEE